MDQLSVHRVRRLALRSLRKLGALRRLNLNVRLDVNGKAVVVPLRGQLGYANVAGTEPWMIGLLTKLRPVYGGAFVDVGVNIGQTLIKAYSVFGKMTYVGFEPNPTCVAYCRELLELNDFGDAVVLPIGVSDDARVMKLNFFHKDAADPTASIIERFRPDQPIERQSYVSVFGSGHLGGVLPKNQSSFVKIDVEGGELEVIKGLSSWIANARPLVLIEVLPVYRPDNEFRLRRQRELEAMFASLGYRPARVVKKDGVGLTKLDEIGVHGDLEHCEYVFYPSELEARVFDCF